MKKFSLILVKINILILILHQMKNSKNKSKSIVGNVILGLATVAGIVGLGFLSMKNLSKSTTHLNEQTDEIKKEFKCWLKNQLTKQRC